MESIHISELYGKGEPETEELNFDIKDDRIVALLDITLQRNMEGGKSSWMHEAAFWIAFELTCN